MVLWTHIFKQNIMVLGVRDRDQRAKQRLGVRHNLPRHKTMPEQTQAYNPTICLPISGLYPLKFPPPLK